MPAEVKADYLRVLVAAGFKHIDAVSFVSKAAVPQMADSELVLEYLGAPGEVEIIGICVNEKGAERAVAAGSVSTVGFPYSVSPTFLKRNQNQTPEEALEALEAVGTVGFKGGLDVVAYISMAFGNPYGDAWSIEEVVDACDLLVDCGVTQISLADTVGLATPKLVGDVVSDVLAVMDNIEIGVHLHSTYEGCGGPGKGGLRGGLQTLRWGDGWARRVSHGGGCAGRQPAYRGVAACAAGAGRGSAGDRWPGRTGEGKWRDWPAVRGQSAVGFTVLWRRARARASGRSTQASVHV